MNETQIVIDRLMMVLIVRCSMVDESSIDGGRWCSMVVWCGVPLMIVDCCSLMQMVLWVVVVRRWSSVVSQVSDELIVIVLIVQMIVDDVHRVDVDGDDGDELMNDRSFNDRS